MLSILNIVVIEYCCNSPAIKLDVNFVREPQTIESIPNLESALLAWNACGMLVAFASNQQISDYVTASSYRIGGKSHIARQRLAGLRTGHDLWEKNQEHED